MQQKTAHEEGHDNYLDDCDTCDLGDSVMAYGDFMNGTDGSSAPTDCDKQISKTVSDGGSGGGGEEQECWNSGGYWTDYGVCLYGQSANEQACWDSGGYWDEATNQCRYGGPGSPIIIDLQREGYHLTSPALGVAFDIQGNGSPSQIAWTDSRYGNAFLALDRNGNGTIDNGKELFGNFTPQPSSPSPNGWAALAVFDHADRGGNGDGVIDSRDAIYAELRVWVDVNHDGISQPNELKTLEEVGITSISLNYKWDGRRDRLGNFFRYRAKVFRNQKESYAYDVFLQMRSVTLQQSWINPGASCRPYTYSLFF